MCLDYRFRPGLNGCVGTIKTIRDSWTRTRRYAWHQCWTKPVTFHYNDVIMGTMASQITSLTIVYSTVYSGADQRKLQSSASLAFVWGIHRSPVNSQHKWPVTRKMSRREMLRNKTFPDTPLALLYDGSTFKKFRLHNDGTTFLYEIWYTIIDMILKIRAVTEECTCPPGFGSRVSSFNSSPLDEMAAISQTIFSYAFSWMDFSY